jgi:hypothetical protein
MAADNGGEDARFGELRWRHFGRIVRKDDEIGVFALLFASRAEVW